MVVRGASAHRSQYVAERVAIVSSGLCLAHRPGRNVSLRAEAGSFGLPEISGPACAQQELLSVTAVTEQAGIPGISVQLPGQLITLTQWAGKRSLHVLPVPLRDERATWGPSNSSFLSPPLLNLREAGSTRAEADGLLPTQTGRVPARTSRAAHPGRYTEDPRAHAAIGDSLTAATQGRRSLDGLEIHVLG